MKYEITLPNISYPFGIKARKHEREAKSPRQALLYVLRDSSALGLSEGTTYLQFFPKWSKDGQIGKYVREINTEVPFNPENFAQRELF